MIKKQIFKCLSGLLIMCLFFTATNSSFTASAQEESTPTLTPTPEIQEPLSTETPTPSEGVFYPTLTPTAILEESAPSGISQFEAQSFTPSQSTQQFMANLVLSNWPAFNISDTDIPSTNPSIAVDINGKINFVWVEIIAGEQEVFYAFWDATNKRLSKSINVSQSPTFYSIVPQIVVGNDGVAHIVWEEEDDDYSADTEVMYSSCNISGCSFPVSLSGPPNWSCVTPPYSLDWKSGSPIIGIDDYDKLMVVWLSSQPGEINQPFSTWQSGVNPPSIPTGCAPIGSLGSSVGHHRVMGSGSGDFRLVFESLPDGGNAQQYYSEYTNGVWSTPIVVSIGSQYSDIFLDSSNQAHIALCTPSGSLNYWNSSTQTLENVLPFGSCEGDAPIVIDSYGNIHVFWKSSQGRIYMIKRDEGIWLEPTVVNDAGSLQSLPDATKDNNGNVHIVWQDFRDGNTEIYYSFPYTCEGVVPESNAGKAVLQVLKDNSVSSLNYCENQVNDLIEIPAHNAGGDNEAFTQWANLINNAENEVAFTSLIWGGSGRQKIAESILSLYRKVTNVTTTSNYPRGMTIRILLGVRQYSPYGAGNIDSRHYVLDDLKQLLRDENNNPITIPIYEELGDGRIWKIEVAAYKYGLETGFPPGIHSHVKLMVVDNSEMIVSGYNVQQQAVTNNGVSENIDAGIKVSGPIAANGMMVFDSLWEGSEILCTEADADNFSQIQNWTTCQTGLGINPAHWIFTPFEDGDIVLPMYRDSSDKTADEAVQVALESATIQIDALQNRFGVFKLGNPPLGYFEMLPLSYEVGIINETVEGTSIRILLEGSEEDNDNGLSNSAYNNRSLANFMYWYRTLGGSSPLQPDQFIRFYKNRQAVHAKVFLVDDNFLVVGSQNFDHSAFGNNYLDLDLVEYSLGIEDNNAINYFNGQNSEGFNFNVEWNAAGKPLAVTQGQSVSATMQQANDGDVVILEDGVHEISSPLTIPEGVVLFGNNATLKPSATFTGGALLRLTNDNVLINGVVIQDSTGYGIEIGDGTTAPENVSISGVVFVNNALGGIHIQSPAGGNPVNYTIENNTFVGDDYGITISANANTTGVIRNNIFAGQEIVPIQITSANDGTVEYSYNLFYDCNNGSCTSNNWIIGNLGTNSSEHDNLFDLDPLFVSPANGDYQLSYNSPAIDAGDPSLLHEFLFDGDSDGIPFADMGAFEYYDLTAPAVQSVTRASINPSSASSIDFTVTFSEPVTGVDTSDFILNTTGVTGAFITNVSGSSAVYTVTVNTGSDNGTIRLDVVDDDTILDNLSNPLSSGFVTGEIYTINKDTWNTFFGGNGNDRSYAVVADASGNFYMSGISSEGWGNPIRAYSGSDDVFVAKVDSSGSLIWNTFLGGAISDGYGYEIALDENGNVYVIGSSDSNWGSPIQAYTDLSDGFVAKLSPSGDLIWNTFIGGSTGYNTVSGIKVSNGTVYVAGNSNSGFGNPINAYTAGNEGYLASLNANTGSLNWHTFFGGSGEDLGFRVYLSNSNNNIYVTGYGNDNWGNPVQPHSTGINNDGHVVKFNSAGTLLWNTFLGADGYDIVYAIDENSTGDLYIAGRSSATWGDPLNMYAGGNLDAFVAELNPDTGILLWHRFVGGSGTDFAWSLEIDSQDNINIAGSSDATWGSPVRTHAGDYEGFYAKLSPVGNLLANSFVGGSGADRGYGIVLGTNNDMYLAGYSTATWDNPIRAYTNSNDAYLTKINISNLPLIVSSITRNTASPTNSSTISFTVTFSEPVTGVDVNDFNLNTTGITGASISNVTGTDATYTVNVNTSSGDGTIRLDVVNNGTILDNESNPLTNDFVTGQLYTIDRNAPTVLSSIKAIANPNLSGLNFTVTFSEPVTDVDISDFGLTTTGVTGTSISSVSGLGNTYTVNVNSGTGSGTVKLNLVDNDTILDLASNPLGGVGAGNGSYTTGQSFTVTSVTLNSLATQDGHILESTENSGVGGTVNSTGTSFVVGDDATDKQYISVMHFNTSTLPDTVSIASATVKVKQQGTATGTNPFTTHGTLIVDLQNPYFGTSNSLVVADFQAIAGQANVATFDSTPISSWYSAFINSTGYVQINLTSTTQIRIRFTLDDNDDNGADYIAFSSGNNTTVANRPQLIIQYYTP